jgi:hypothetical protein
MQMHNTPDGTPTSSRKQLALLLCVGITSWRTWCVVSQILDDDDDEAGGAGLATLAQQRASALSARQQAQEAQDGE